MRAAWVDRSKGILILLVMLGHVLGAGGGLASDFVGNVLTFCRDEIYLFHMPAFFILAGWLWTVRSDEGIVEFVWKKWMRLAVPYFVFGAMSMFVFAFVKGFDHWWQPVVSLIHGGGWPNGQGFQCNSVLWFLPCMFVVLLVNKLFDGVNEWLFGRWHLWLAVCLCSWFVRVVFYRYHIDVLPWGMVSAFWYLPFVLIGRALRRCEFRERSSSWLITGTLVCVILLEAARLVRAAAHCRLACWTGFSCAITAALAGTFAILLIARLSIWTRSGFSTCGAALEKLGIASMGIMLFHKFPVVFLQEHVGCIRRMFGDNLWIAFTGVLVVSAFATVTSYVGYLAVKRYVGWMKI